MHNWGYQTTTGTRIEFKNLLNQIGEDKTSNTFGWNNYRQGNFNILAINIQVEPFIQDS